MKKSNLILIIVLVIIVAVIFGYFFMKGQLLFFDLDIVTLGPKNLTSTNASSPVIPYHNGWPVELQGLYSNEIEAGVFFVDLNGDGISEIFVRTTSDLRGQPHSRVIRFDKNGNILWSNKFDSHDLRLAFADLNNDGIREIVLLDGENWKIYIFNEDGSIFDPSFWPVDFKSLLNFSQNENYDFCSTPAIGDFSGEKRIVFTCDYHHCDDLSGNCKSEARMFVFGTRGRLINNWIVDTLEYRVEQQVLFSTSNRLKSVVIADLNRDGSPEIGIATMKLLDDIGDGGIFFYYINGSTFPGWPAKFSNRGFSASPVIGNLYNDGKFYLVVGGDGGIYILNSTGGVIRHSDGYGTYSDPLALYDVDRDNDLEIVTDQVVLNNKLNTLFYSADAYRSYSWPPTIGDIDNDGQIEVINSDVYDNIFFIRKLGVTNVIHGESINQYAEQRGAVGEIDGDEYYELRVTSSSSTDPNNLRSYVRVFDLPYRRTPIDLDWKYQYFDEENTGCYLCYV